MNFHTWHASSYYISHVWHGFCKAHSSSEESTRVKVYSEAPGTVPDMQLALSSKPSSAVNSDSPGQSEDSLSTKPNQLLSCPQWSVCGYRKQSFQAEPDISKHPTPFALMNRSHFLECPRCQTGDYRGKEIMVGLCSFHLFVLIYLFMRLGKRKNCSEATDIYMQKRYLTAVYLPDNSARRPLWKGSGQAQQMP